MRIGDAFGSSSHLKAADLKGKTARVTIQDVTFEKVGDGDKPILHFVGKDKTLVLNRTNALRIAEAVGTDETDAWPGWTITLYVCKVDYNGQRVDAIRVDDRPGATKQPERTARRAAPVVEEPPAHDAPDITEDEIPF